MCACMLAHLWTWKAKAQPPTQNAGPPPPAMSVRALAALVESPQWQQTRFALNLLGHTLQPRLFRKKICLVSRLIHLICLAAFQGVFFNSFPLSFTYKTKKYLVPVVGAMRGAVSNGWRLVERAHASSRVGVGRRACLIQPHKAPA